VALAPDVTFSGPAINITSLPVGVSNLTEAEYAHHSLLSGISFFDNLTSNPAFNKLVTDILEGQIITLSVVVAFILVFLIREWVVQQQPMINMGINGGEAHEIREVGGHAEPARVPEEQNAVDVVHEPPLGASVALDYTDDLVLAGEEHVEKLVAEVMGAARMNDDVIREPHVSASPVGALVDLGDRWHGGGENSDVWFVACPTERFRRVYVTALTTE